MRRSRFGIEKSFDESAACLNEKEGRHSAEREDGEEAAGVSGGHDGSCATEEEHRSYVSAASATRTPACAPRTTRCSNAATGHQRAVSSAGGRLARQGTNQGSVAVSKNQRICAPRSPAPLAASPGSRLATRNPARPRAEKPAGAGARRSEEGRTERPSEDAPGVQPAAGARRRARQRRDCRVSTACSQNLVAFIRPEQMR